MTIITRLTQALKRRMAAWFPGWKRREQQLAEIYRQHGQEPPPPISGGQFIRGLWGMIPLILFFSFAAVVWTAWIFWLAGASLYCGITGAKNPYDRPARTNG